MKLVIYALIFGFSSAAMAFGDCYNGVAPSNWTQYRVHPDAVKFSVRTSDAYEMIAKVDSRVTVINHHYVAACGLFGVISPEEAAKSAQRAAAALRLAPSNIEENVSLVGSWIDSSAIHMTKRDRIARTSQISDTESVVTYSNPEMQQMLNACRDAQAEALGSHKDLILTPFGDLAESSLCTVAP